MPVLPEGHSTSTRITEDSNMPCRAGLVPGGGGVVPEKLGGGVQPASQNPYPIYDQNLRYSLPFL